MFKLNKKRIPMVIGSGGETKREIEETLGVEIDIDSSTGEVEVKPDLERENYNPLNLIVAEKVIRAINRGFNPNKALKLKNDEIILEVINLASILGKSRKKLKRIKGRLIGRNGEIREAIEENAECYISIFGKTISVIADHENMQIAKKAINMIINGMPHHTILKYLENMYKKKQKERFKKMYKPDFS
ncbi:MAG: RNA-processing protein [Promethearchaeota archaeon]|nr:MAG: RNA-processing protein [Candidatus Lokiarchaeota archaeon]